jgi:hypothetical protein
MVAERAVCSQSKLSYPGYLRVSISGFPIPVFSVHPDSALQNIIGRKRLRALDVRSRAEVR